MARHWPLYVAYSTTLCIPRLVVQAHHCVSFFKCQEKTNISQFFFVSSRNTRFHRFIHNKDFFSSRALLCWLTPTNSKAVTTVYYRHVSYGTFSRVQQWCEANSPQPACKFEPAVVNVSSCRWISSTRALAMLFHAPEVKFVPRPYLPLRHEWGSLQCHNERYSAVQEEPQGWSYSLIQSWVYPVVKQDEQQRKKVTGWSWWKTTSNLYMCPYFKHTSRGRSHGEWASCWTDTFPKRLEWNNFLSECVRRSRNLPRSLC